MHQIYFPRIKAQKELDTRVGFSGDYGGSYFMTQLIGSAKARELYLLSDRVSAEEALDLGLANWKIGRASCRERV